jgi:hypothetical protein
VHALLGTMSKIKMSKIKMSKIKMSKIKMRQRIVELEHENMDLGRELKKVCKLATPVLRVASEIVDAVIDADIGSADPFALLIDRWNFVAPDLLEHLGKPEEPAL